MKDIKRIQEITANTEYVILEEYPQIDYTLIVRRSSFEPYVAAWGYDKESTSWAQGHYFSTLIDAVNYIESKFKEGGLA